jgi:MoaA/NifB/PqqE/SkfB family radical SAM enzyme
MNKQIKQLGIDVDRSTFLWNLIDICNYKCSYCNAPHGTNYNDFKKFNYNKRSVWKQVVNRLSVRSIGMFNLEILGGEPTLHPELHNICTKLCVGDNCKRMDIYTNLSKSVDYFKEYQHLNVVRFIAAYHPQYYNDKFIEKIKQLNMNRPGFIIPSINMSPDPIHWDQMERLINTCIDENIDFRINFLHSIQSGMEGDIPDVDTKKNPGFKNTITYTDQFWYRFEDMVNNNWKSLTNTNYTKPSKSMREYVSEDMVNVRNMFIPGYELPITYVDGDKSTITEGNLVEKNLNRFKGYNCKTRLYYIDLDGQIVNYCTGESLPIYINEQELSKCRICPRDVCDRRAFIYEDKTKYYRELVDEKHT